MARLDGLGGTDRQELEEELERAAIEAAAPEPPRDVIVSRLDRVKQRLSGLDGVAAGALALAKTAAGISGWVAAFL